MVEEYLQTLPHGITLSCRASGQQGRPVLMFLHGFPEAAFIWDELLLHFSDPANGGFRCVAPNLRGFERSSAPPDVKDYRPKHLVQDIAALIAVEGAPLAALVAHDWGGAVAWNLANQQPDLMRRLVIINSPHPATFLRELQHNPAQQAASAYMNELVAPGAEARLAADDFKGMWAFFTTLMGTDATPAWLSDEVRAQYRAVWQGAPGAAVGEGLRGGCNYYRASPLRPPRPQDPAAAAVTLPREIVTVDVPTLVLWAQDDVALPPTLTEGLEDYVSELTLRTVAGASHWVIHEKPDWVRDAIGTFLLSKS